MRARENENQVLIGALLWLAMTASVVAIPIVMFPILRKHNEGLALGYVGARIFEGFFEAVNVVSLLSLLSLSREFVTAGAPVASYFQTSGALLLAVIDWGSLLLDACMPVKLLPRYKKILCEKTCCYQQMRYACIGVEVVSRLCAHAECR